MSGIIDQVDWGQVLSYAGLSAIVSGFVSSLINYKITIKQYKKKSQANLIEEKLRLYSFIIYHLDKMKLKGDAIQSIKGVIEPEDKLMHSGDELDKTFESVDSEIQNRLYLLNYEILKEWIFTKTLAYQPQVGEHIQKLRTLLIQEYNDEIIPKYTELVGEGVPKIPLPKIKNNET